MKRKIQGMVTGILAAVAVPPMTCQAEEAWEIVDYITVPEGFFEEEQSRREKPQAGNQAEQGGSRASGEEQGDSQESREELETEIREEILCLVNEMRAEKGRTLLSPDEELARAAGLRAQEAAHLRGAKAHIRPDGSGYETAVEEDYRYVSENLAWIGFGREASGADIAKDAVNFWKDSPAHQSNLMREDWEKTGIGLFWEEGKVCIVQMFAGM